MASAYEPTSRIISAYGSGFEGRLADHGIYHENRAIQLGTQIPEPENLREICRALKRRRASVGDRASIEREYAGFRKITSENYSEDYSEAKAMRLVIPFLEGPRKSMHAESRSEDKTLFTNLVSMTNGLTTAPKPDLWDGMHPSTVHPLVKEALGDLIMPTKNDDFPIVPNFFLESSPMADVGVGVRQALNDGAYGARAMYTLHQYGLGNPYHDNKAYTFSVTYYTGVLNLFAHHSTVMPDGSLEYWMTLIKQCPLLRQKDYAKAVTEFRNLRDLAQSYRIEAIAMANSRAMDGKVAGREMALKVIREHCQQMDVDKFDDDIDSGEEARDEYHTEDDSGAETLRAYEDDDEDSDENSDEDGEESSDKESSEDSHGKDSRESYEEPEDSVGQKQGYL